MVSIVFVLIVAAFIMAVIGLYQSGPRAPIAWAVFLLALAMLFGQLPGLP